MGWIILIIRKSKLKPVCRAGQDLKSKNWKEKAERVFIKHLELAKEVNNKLLSIGDAHKDLLGNYFSFLIFRLLLI